MTRVDVVARHVDELFGDERRGVDHKVRDR